MRMLLVVALASCGGAAIQSGSLASLREVCSTGEYWDGRACAKAGDAPGKLDAGAKALAELKVDDAKRDLDAAEHAGPLDHDHHVLLWEQRGIAAAYVDDEPGAKAAFDMMLALDPTHILSYTLSPKATFVFESVRKSTKEAPAIDVNWSRGGKVGDPVPVDVEVVADPKKFLKHATLFVRTRGDARWRATDLTLDARERHVVLPPVVAQKPVSLELYLRAYDDQHNEVLAWADPGKPREIPLRYDPPQRWYTKWWVLTIAGGVLLAGTSATVYELEHAPPDKVNGGAGLGH